MQIWVGSSVLLLSPPKPLFQFKGHIQEQLESFSAQILHGDLTFPLRNIFLMRDSALYHTDIPHCTDKS